MSPVPALPRGSGTSMPQLSFGVLQIKPEETATAVQTALEAGYRHIDTAQMFQNEAGVGAAGADPPGRRFRHEQAQQRLPSPG